jgi:hypothetical protein
MNCTMNNICQCGTYWYHNYPILTCSPQQDYSGACAVDFNCRVDKYLECKNGACVCISAYPLYSDGYGKCIVPKSYNQYCYDHLDCNSALGLGCHNGTQNCTCPSTIANNFCDCQRVANAEYYWNGVKCMPALGYYQNCLNRSSSYMCKTLTEGTICAGSFPYLCKCPSLQYYNNVTKKCEAQLMNGFVCLAADACRSDRGLICKNSICQCDSTKQFWSNTSTICKNFYTYNTGTCTADNECNTAATKLICRTAGSTSCSCPLTVASGKCDCPTRVVDEERLWNGTACVYAGEYGDSCVIGYQCQELTELLKCDTCSTFKCVCSDCLWDSGNEKCAKCSAGWSCHNSACYTAVTHSSSICSNQWRRTRIKTGEAWKKNLI